MSRLCLRTVTILMFTCLPMSAAHADYWGASLVTATPQFHAGGAVEMATVIDTPNGHGVVSEAPWVCENGFNCQSLARLFVTVTEPRGSRFDTLWLRADDSDSGGYVRAAFYRQNLLGGPPELLGQVTTQDAGHQVVMDSVKATDSNGNVGPVVIGPLAPFEPTYTYFIEINIVIDELVFDPDAALIGYDVGFDLDPCSSPELPSFDGASCF